ncbi:MAG: ATP-dependent zinc metalloprotease FtsH [Proteobacteria bacterium]|nr:ATP-dependent zinc metalloprotease FtsH [Pseudomonadota bacterium]
MAKPPQKQNQQMRITMLFLGILGLFLLVHLMVKPQDEPKTVKFSDFMTAVSLPLTDEQRVAEVTFKENEILGVRGDKTTFKTYGPNDADMRKTLTEKGVKVNYEPPEEMSWWKTLLINSLPLVIILLLFVFFMRQLQIGGGKAMSFGKSRAKLLNENQTRVTFDDIAGIDEAKQELEEIIEFLKDPKKFTRLGGRIPKGVLLVGSPGTGKTVLAKAIAGEAGVPFFSISGSDFVEMFVGVGASRVRDLFDQSKKHAPCIVFIDEIDAVGRHRGAGVGGGHDEREQTLNQLLVEMDGFEANEGVIIIAATNRADVLDPALLRPGRFDRRVIVPKPDVKGREGILKVHTRKSPLAKDVDLPTIAQGTPGFSGADLENLVNEAALIAARQDCKEVSMHHFELAKDKILMGPERKSMIMSVEEKRNTAYHEAGHAIVGLFIGGVDPVHKVSIIPRGQALGVTIMLPAEDRYTLTKEYAEGMIAYAMGGRAAEEIVFRKQTTGAGDDINKATDIARKMVCNWGMSERLGPLSFGKESDEVFLGREMGGGRNFSEKVAEEIDAEIHRIVSGGYRKAVSILRDNRVQLESLAESLLIKETLDRTQIENLMRGVQVVTDEERKAFEDAQKKAKELKKNPPQRANLAESVDRPDVSEAPPLSALPLGT